MKADIGSPFAFVRRKISSEIGKTFPVDAGKKRMKHEQNAGARRPASVGAATETPSYQSANGAVRDMNVDLTHAAVGEYRFQGELIRAFYVDERTWFIATEVCAVLELANPRQVIKALRSVQRGVSSMDTPGGIQPVNLITESGLYVLIFKSRKPQAEAFQIWVTDEVLPQIRRTGAYSARGRLGDDASIVIPPPDRPTRFIVTAAPGDAPHIRRTTLDEALTEFTGLDRQAMCYTLKQIEVWWNKVQIKASVRVAHDDGFAIHKLDETIRNGSEMADHFLDVAP
ncbi:MAG: hypothetical protein KGH75_03525 [Rhodospirillales bacterium]|nr:hypothetical protein [Rhodospirillales bacterium]